MGTTQNTAAIYIRKSSTDNRSGSNRSLSEQRHECLVAAEREGSPSSRPTRSLGVVVLTGERVIRKTRAS